MGLSQFVITAWYNHIQIYMQLQLIQENIYEIRGQKIMIHCPLTTIIKTQ